MKTEKITSVRHSSVAIASRVWCVNWNFSGKVLASCGDDKSIKVWEYSHDAGLRKLNTLSGDHTRTVRCASFSPCGKYLVSGSFDATVIIYEYSNGDFEEAHKLEGHENEIKSCQFSTSGEFLATCSRDKTVWVWQVDENGDYEVGSILQNHSADVKFVVWHPTDDILVSGGYDCSIRFYIFDGEDWVTQHAIQEAHDNTVWDGAFDVSGNFLATCGADCAIKVWKKNEQPVEGRRWTKLLDHPVLDTRWPLYSISWNHESAIIAAGGGDCTIRFFSLDEENSALTWLHSISLDSEINCLRWNPVEKNVLGAACDDGTISVIEVADYC